MDFARKQLQKYGWKEGDALGKDATGIKEPIKPKLKFDTNGIGYSYGDDECFPWWEHVYNKASSNITTVQEQDGTTRLKRTSKTLEIEPKESQRTKKRSIQKTFTKGGTLIKDGVVIPQPRNDEVFETHIVTKSEDLFKICGGRTAHKGARHGITSRGKLGRVEKLDRLLLEQMKSKH